MGAVRIMQHRGHKKAVIAVAHAMLVVAYHLLTRGTTYHELGDDHHDRRQAERAKRRALETLGRQGLPGDPRTRSMTDW
jgi:transposase